MALEHSGDYGNPYIEAAATAELVGPDGHAHAAPLFWEGGRTWKFRFSPDKAGDWKWSTTSDDAGLAGKSGTFRVVESGQQGGIEPLAAHAQHFQRQDGTPFWFLGDTAWALYTDSQAERHDFDAMRHYVDVRAGQGFNVVHSMLLSEAGWGNRGGPPFHDLDNEQINPGYWQEVDRRLAYVNERGLVAGLAIAWGDKRRVEPYAWRRFPSLAARKRYAQYIAARYAAYDVYFIVSGEWHAEANTRDGASEADVKREFIEIGDALRAADPHRRMVAIHPMTSHGSVREFTAADWMTFGDYQQNYEDLHARVLASRGKGPVVNSEYAYFLRDQNGDGRTDKDNSVDADAIRHASWDIVMAGGYLVTGFGTTYFGGNRDPGPFDVDAEKNDVWEHQVQHIPALFTKLEWWKLVPRDDLITSDTPRGEDRHQRVVLPPGATYWLLAEEGATYVAYVRGCDAVRIEARAGLYDAAQFNPRTQDRKPLGRTQIADAFEYQPPDRQDWVVLLQSRS